MNREGKMEILVKMRSQHLAAIIIALAALPLISDCAAQASTATLTTLYNFTSSPGGAENPGGPLTIGVGGVLIGTAGGNDGFGTVFQLSPPASPGAPWTEMILHGFGSFHGGFGPSGGVAIGSNGVLYGTTTLSDGDHQCGNVFGLIPRMSLGPRAAVDWVEAPVFNRFDFYNGCQPGGVVIGRDGALYGTTAGGGPIQSACNPGGCGTVFKLAPPGSPLSEWTHTVLFNFTAQSGWLPLGGLTMSESGELYGTTFFDGLGGAGTVFELKPPSSPGGTWGFSLLYSFTNANGDGGGPSAGVVIGPNGSIYGVTQNGGANGFGTVFELKPPVSRGGAWSEAVIYSFGGADGAEPETGLAIGPGLGSALALYGTTWYGGSGPCAPTGAPRGCGTIFVMTPSATGTNWTETVLHSFTNDDGAKPDGTLVVGPSTGGQIELYGTTLVGGSSANCSSDLGAGCGTAFRLTL
jgi:uncharacterized repeat protein (TIGR03803 family)